MDPCADFFAFSCNNHRARNWDEEIDAELLEILEEPINGDDHYLVKSEKELFKACMNESVAEHNSLKIFEDLLKELNGWPVVLGDKWKDRQFEWTDMVIKLRKKGYFDSMLLSIDMGADPLEEDERILYVINDEVPKSNW